MKNQLFLQLILIACLQQIYGQTTDNQWLIRNGIGKNGANQNAQGDYISIYQENQANYQIQDNYFLLNGVRHPVRNPAAPREKNDIFIIFSDWTHLNTREKDASLPYDQDIDLFYPYNNPGILTQTTHRFENTTTAEILYMYLSNIYEDDDIPPGVSLSNGSNGNSSTPYQLGPRTDANRLSANHNVTPNSDVTLIVKNGSWLTSGDSLLFNQTKQFGFSEINKDKYFNVLDLGLNMQNQFLSNVPITVLPNGALTFDNVPSPTLVPYIFITVHPTNKLPEYYPSPEDAKFNSEAIFTLKKPMGSLPTAELRENILSYHDPNYVQVVSVCSKNRSDYFVYYHIEFVNTGLEPADKLKIQLMLPNYLDPSCIQVNKWVVGDNTYSMKDKCDINTKGNGIFEFIFPPAAEVVSYDPQHPELSIGYIEFCAKVKGDQVPNIKTLDFKTNKTIVFFDTKAYGLDRFIAYKPPKPGDNRVRIPNTISGCNCKCSRY